MKAKISADSQICISVPLNQTLEHSNYSFAPFFFQSMQAPLECNTRLIMQFETHFLAS